MSETKENIMESKVTELKESIAAMKVKQANFFKKSVSVLFEQYSVLEAIVWNQYTPSFNDGDPCTFSIDEFRVKFDGGHEDSDYEDDTYDSYSEFPDEPDKEQAIKYVNEMCSQFPEAMCLNMFGDDVTVTLTKDGFTTDEYDCGY